VVVAPLSPALHLPLQAYDGSVLIGAVIGKAEQHKGRLRGYIGMLAVEREYRKHGLGLQLAARVVDAMTRTCDEIVLETELTNTPALRLYEKLGFVRDKRLPRYYMNGNDAYRLKVWVTDR
jgi:peptide alpha-N-acetyltransferase